MQVLLQVFRTILAHIFGSTDISMMVRTIRTALLAAGERGADQAPVSYAACHQALDTAELLEEILTHLPIRDLLFAQRICHQWKDCIDSSKRLQQGLFFRAPGDRAAMDLLTFYKDDLAAGAERKVFKTRLDNWLYTIPATVNPLIRSSFGATGLSKHTMQPDHLCRLSEAYLRSEASWRRMNQSYPVVQMSNAEGFAKAIEATLERVPLVGVQMGTRFRRRIAADI